MEGHTGWRASYLKYFLPNEFHDYKAMYPLFLAMLDEFRDRLGAPVKITSSNNPKEGHAKESDHYKGRAVDFIAPVLPEMVWKLANKMGFGGIGLYMTSKKEYYYHLAHYGKDVSDKWIGTWIGGKLQYKPATKENLKIFGIV
jgi:hypothetical protein